MRVRDPIDFQPYRVPWRVDRVHDSHPLVTNGSDEPADAVRIFRADTAAERADTAHWGRLLPGDTAELCLCDADLDSTVVTVCWFRPTTGQEYAWRFVM